MYILPDARASYRHWWEQQVYWLEQSYRWDKFKSIADEIGYLYPHLRRKPIKRRRYSRWGGLNTYVRPWDISTSGESSFRQDGYEPKIQDDCATSRQDWREHKQFQRDKAKHCGHRYSNAGWYGKKIVHSARRQHEREMIAHGRYDEISQNVQDVVRCWWD